ncbi:uncharacterized protein LOC121594719 [Anopheles merus]|uniref:uncharacterized protein LOC121594719 n=1 Tax=Anopheles merus TaxID=30066 RepID=UPI001BE46E9C|nr:uncharacterized protein LOC121594719 [Anopheles merus]
MFQLLQKILYIIIYRNIEPRDDPFKLDVSVDGLPLHKGGPTQVWPILVKAVDLPKLPLMLVAAYSGHTKPSSVEEFLRPLVNDFNIIQRGGLTIGDKTLQFRVRNFIADTPARAFILATTNHNGYDSCLKCTCHGEWCEEGKKIIFDSVDAPLRTDEGFRGRVILNHHQEWRTPLEELDNFDLVDNAPTSEREHLCDEGCTRFMQRGFMFGKFPRNKKWTPLQMEAASKFLMQTKLPTEIHRSFRLLRYHAFWKATEWRSYLHYASVVVLKDLVDPIAYGHFLLYFSAVTIFSTKFHQHLWLRARDYLRIFVKNFGQVYGRKYLTSNIHLLVHIYKDVEKFGALDDFSAYATENFLQNFPRWVRAGTKCVEQIANRSSDLMSLDLVATPPAPQYPMLKANGVGLHVTADFVLLPKFQDQWFLTKDNGIVKFLSAKTSGSHDITVVGIRFLTMAALYEISAEGGVIAPMSSAEIHVYQTMENAPAVVVEVPWTAIRCKMVAVKQPTRPLNLPPIDPSPNSTIPSAIAFFPLLHTFIPD